MAWGVILTPLLLLVAAALALMKPFFTESLGIGREVSALNNANCQQIPELQACEDSWLHHDTGLLYLACASSVSARAKYVPALSIFSSKFEPPSGDYVAIYDTRSTVQPLSSRITKLKVEGFHGNRGEGQFNLHGINVEVLNSSEGSKPKLRIFLNNHRPTLDDKLNYLDGNKYGANSTIETFDTVLGSNSMQHVKTYASENHIRTPNFIAPLDSTSFFFTNDHREKVSWKRDLGMIRPRTDISFCNEQRCYPSALDLPGANGLVRSKDDEKLFFLASSTQGYVRTLRLEDDNSLTVKDIIHTGMPADNLNVDESGDIWVAAFPKGLTTLAHFQNPHEKVSPTTVFKISRNKVVGRLIWNVEKVFEDDGNVASGITVATYDVRTHHLYLSGVMSPALTICQLP